MKHTQIIRVRFISVEGRPVIPTLNVNACRDPKDDKFLEAALADEAECLVSGDADLLEIASFEDIPIMRLAEF